MNELAETEEIQEVDNSLANLFGHMGLAAEVGEVECPICGAGTEKLQWTGCDLSIEEADEMATEQYKEAVEDANKVVNQYTDS